MKKTILVFIVCLALCTGHATAQQRDIGSLDGHDWTQWQAGAKAGFIGGFIAGTGHVIGHNVKPQDKRFESSQVMQAYISYHAKRSAKPKETFSREEVTMVLGKSQEVFNNQLYAYNIFGIPDGQIVDGLDLLYREAENKSIKLVDAVYLVKRKIKGASPEEQEAIRQYLKGGKDSGKLLYKDADGEMKLVSFP